MEKWTIEKYMDERWQAQYNYHSGVAKRNKKFYQTFRVVEIILAASIPYLNSIAGEDVLLNHIVSLKGVLISVLAGLMLVYKFHERWVDSRLIAENLSNERVLFLTQAGLYKAETRDEKFVERIERILSGNNKEWAKDHLEKEEKAA